MAPPSIHSYAYDVGDPAHVPYEAVNTVPLGPWTPEGLIDGAVVLQGRFNTALFEASTYGDVPFAFVAATFRVSVLP